MLLKFLGRLLSHSDEVSSNRTIAIISFVIFIAVIVYSVVNELFHESIITYLEYLLIIILSGLGFKGVEKVVSLFNKK